MYGKIGSLNTGWYDNLQILLYGSNVHLKSSSRVKLLLFFIPHRYQGTARSYPRVPWATRWHQILVWRCSSWSW